jgi:hypothetical protein
MEESLHPKESRGVVEREEGVVCGRVNKGGGRRREREKTMQLEKIYKEGEIGGAKHGRTIRFFPIPSFSQKHKKINPFLFFLYFSLLKL